MGYTCKETQQNTRNDPLFKWLSGLGEWDADGLIRAGKKQVLNSSLIERLMVQARQTIKGDRPTAARLQACVDLLIDDTITTPPVFKPKTPAAKRGRRPKATPASCTARETEPEPHKEPATLAETSQALALFVEVKNIYGSFLIKKTGEEKFERITDRIYKEIRAHLIAALPERSISREITREALRTLYRRNVPAVLRKFEIVHGNEYDYSEMVYLGAHRPITVICREHGAFKTTPTNHLRGRRCIKCARTRGGLLNRIPAEEFERRARLRHGDRFIYCGDYVHMKQHITVICRKHGTFKTLPDHHLRPDKNGCPTCAKESRAEKLRIYHQSVKYKKQLALINGSAHACIVQAAKRRTAQK
ncbi:hypothetical protein KE423_003896 [Salmonella enterica]|nr:hypothetical protein [Salmonella enterica]